MARPMGRPRIYDSPAEKMRAYRASKKQKGAMRIDCYLPSKYWDRLTLVRQETGSSLSRGICFLLDRYFEGIEKTAK